MFKRKTVIDCLVYALTRILMSKSSRLLHFIALLFGIHLVGFALELDSGSYTIRTHMLLVVNQYFCNSLIGRIY